MRGEMPPEETAEKTSQASELDAHSQAVFPFNSRK